MKDIENELYALVKARLAEEMPEVFTTQERPNGLPKQLPCVAFLEADNFTAAATIDSSGRQKYADLTYTATAYSNKVAGRKSEAKKIINIVDEIMFGMNFRRESSMPETPINDGKIYVQASRYVARTDGENIIRI